jgi:peptidoglycan/xylan/chitin deacetylase (PgdA/CDA1 family)
MLTTHGMATGNHTFSHIKAHIGNKKEYLDDVDKCSELIKSKLFRPPYGKIYPWWLPDLKKRFDKIVMWDIISLDYDNTLTGEEVVNNVITNIRSGSVIVFHDSLKAWDRMKYALPKVLEYAINNGYSFGIIE